MKLRRILFCLWLVTVCCYPSFSQTKAEFHRTADSILLVLANTPVQYDTAWLSYVRRLVHLKIPSSKSSQMLPHFYRYLAVAKKLDSPTHLAWCYGELGRAEALDMAQNLRYMDTLLQVLPRVEKIEIYAYQAADFAAQIYAQNRLLLKELQARKQWGELAEKEKNYANIAGVKPLLASIYFRAGMYDKSKALLRSSLEMMAHPKSDTSINIMWSKLYVYAQISDLYEQQKQRDSAWYFLKEGYYYAERMRQEQPNIWSPRMSAYAAGLLVGYDMRIGALDSCEAHLPLYAATVRQASPDDDHHAGYEELIAQYYLKRHRYDEALQALNRAEEWVRQYGRSFNVKRYALFGQTLQALNRQKEAIVYYEKAFNLAVKDKPFYLTYGHLLPVSDSLANLFRAAGVPDKALFYAQQSNLFRQELIDQTASKEFIGKEVAAYEEHNADLVNANRTQKQWLYLTVFGILVALLFVVFSGYQLWVRRRLYRELELAQQKSEALLMNILPVEIATRLKQSSTSIVDGFDEASVIFIDIVGFTQISAAESPASVVGLLNEIFVCFDRLTDQYGLEKVKTIGDCFMAVAGVPTPCSNHLQRCLDLGLAILQLKEKFWVNGQPVQFRIGIETGPVVAGIIGEKRFLYDLWGDVVNTASRMESNGLPNTIQTTDRVYELVKKQYNFKERGLIEVKGKGSMRTWLLEAATIV